jgi:hypothetical protein
MPEPEKVVVPERPAKTNAEPALLSTDAVKPQASGLSDPQLRVLRALVGAKVWGDTPDQEKVNTWVRSASVHDSAAPHGLEGRQVPPVWQPSSVPAW